MKPLIPLCLVALSSLSSAQSLELSIAQAQKNDPWIKHSQAQQHALIAQGDAANSWMNPKVSVMAANLPVPNGEGDWDINNEGMTQLKASVSQMFPKADTLQLKQQKFTQLSQGQIDQRFARAAKVELTVSTLWLNALNTQKSLKIVQKNFQWFEQLLTLSENNYRLGFRQTDSQDIVSAELQLLRLDDRILMLQQKLDQQVAKLGEYIANDNSVKGEKLPSHKTAQQQVSTWLKLSDVDRTTWLLKHPNIVALEANLNAEQTNIALANADNNLQWGVSASYAYRLDNPMGQDRSDLFSVGLSVEIPVFTQGKSEAKKQAANFKTESIVAQQTLTLNKLNAQFDKAASQWRNNEKRLRLYSEFLLAKSSEQTESALNAYTNGEGQFKQVVSARIVELDTQLKQLDLINQKHLLIAQFNFLMAASDAQSAIKPAKQEGFQK